MYLVIRIYKNTVTHKYSTKCSYTYFYIPVSFIQVLALPDEYFAVLTTTGDSTGSEASVRRPGHVPHPVVVPFQLRLHLPYILFVTEVDNFLTKGEEKTERTENV